MDGYDNSKVDFIDAKNQMFVDFFLISGSPTIKLFY